MKMLKNNCPVCDDPGPMHIDRFFHDVDNNSMVLKFHCGKCKSNIHFDIFNSDLIKEYVSKVDQNKEVENSQPKARLDLMKTRPN